MSSSALAPLWQISAELTALLDTIDLTPDEQRPEIQAEIDRYLGMEAAKVDQVAHVLAALDYEQRAASDEIVRLQDRNKAAAKSQERLEQYVCRVIGSRGVKRLAGVTNTLSVRNRDAVVILDAAVIPAVWMRTKVTVEPDKTAIKAALKAGEDIPGADLEFHTSLVRK